jgi:hypothetical protein
MVSAMELSEAAIEEYRALYVQHYGKSITHDEAAIQAERLMLLVAAIQPDTP